MEDVASIRIDLIVFLIFLAIIYASIYIAYEVGRYDERKEIATRQKARRARRMLRK